LYFLAGYSDYLDGVLARRWKVESNFGAYWDPVADKALVFGLLLILSLHFPIGIPLIAVVVIGVRDILATYLRNYAEKHQKVFKTSYVAKVKTTVQMFYLLFLLAMVVAWHFWKPQIDPLLNGWLIQLSTTLVAALTVWSVVPYLSVFKKG
jgi:CDP-diacylglycerol--glycerol-3-phosphate 3-phosphatidyltransferase